MENMKPLIKAIKAGYQYGSPSGPITALEGVDLTISPGEHVALIGPNGSGKSTLLKLFNALLYPTTGEMLVSGRDTSDPDALWEIRRDCGMVFQNPDNQIVATTVEEDVAFGLENLQVPTAEMRERVDEALETMELSDWAQHAPHLLSGGQKQRVALAGIMAMRPRCLLLDEATSQLDPREKSEVMQILQHLNRKEGIALINVTHFLEEAALADRVIVLYRGEIVKDGFPYTILDDSKELGKWCLEPPPAAKLAKNLKNRDAPISSGVVTMEKLVEQICSWK